jgi:hypothetical protein
MGHTVGSFFVGVGGTLFYDALLVTRLYSVNDKVTGE